MQKCNLLCKTLIYQFSLFFIYKLFYIPEIFELMWILIEIVDFLRLCLFTVTDYYPDIFQKLFTFSCFFTLRHAYLITALLFWKEPYVGHVNDISPTKVEKSTHYIYIFIIIIISLKCDLFEIGDVAWGAQVEWKKKFLETFSLGGGYYAVCLGLLVF